MTKSELKTNFEAASQPIRTLEEAALVDPVAAEYLRDIQSAAPKNIRNPEEVEREDDQNVVNVAYVTDMQRGLVNIHQIREELGLPEIELVPGGTLSQRFEQYVAQHIQDVVALEGKASPVGENVKFLTPSEEVTRAVDAERAEYGIFDPSQTLG